MEYYQFIMLICTNDAFQLKLEFPSSQLELDPPLKLDFQ